MDTSVMTKAWSHSESARIIRTPRTDWIDGIAYARILRSAHLDPYR
jgi:hypothetical protein